MAKAKRVYQIAKEIGVESKAIVAKCQAEGVPDVENHMSTVKLGLQQTIREWFSAADAGTAVETAEKVDLDKVRRARRRKAVAAGAAGQEADTQEAEQDEAQASAEVEAEAVEAPEAPEPEKASPAPAAELEPEAPAPAQEQAKQPEASEPEAAPEPEPAQEQPSEPAPAAAEASDEQAPEPSEEQDEEGRVAPAGELNVPSRPDVIKPAGEQLKKPQQAQLKGPRVVRVEAPEPEPQRRGPRGPRRGPGGPDTGGPMAPPPGSVPGITRSKGPAGGRGVPGAGFEREEAPPRGGKRRSRTSRRGRSADSLPTGPTKFSEQDLLELDAKLKGATGFLKQRRRDMKKRGQHHQQALTPAVVGGKVEIAEPITIKDFSASTGIKTSDIIKYLFKQGIMATINSAISADAAMEVALEYDIELIVKQQKTAAEQVEQEFESREEVDVRPRPPVVTVLGHVDHGKTSLLDRIRLADVAEHEAGGITQHIGAYRVTVPGADEEEKTTVFLDTPGHEAFTSMRARGANLTDLVVLVVAADDGVMPQTIESINHAKAAGVPIVVALNKIDKPEATDDNIHKIYGQLAEHGLNPTEWGGETEIVKVSAIANTGIQDLLEIIDYQAQLLELKADYGGAARGLVIESEMQPGRGPVARVLVQDGTIKVGGFIVIGRSFGRVRDMIDDRGRSVQDAGPATPLEISGIDILPDAGDKFFVTDTLGKAEDVANHFRDTEREQQLASQNKVTLDNFAARLKAGETKDLRVVLKADVQGSIDVLKKSLSELGNDEVAVKVLHAAVGGITESDVLLADASDAIIVGFHVAVSPPVRDLADARSVDVRLYRVIYTLTDEIKKAMEGMLEPEIKEEPVGAAEVREIFKVSKVGTIAGCLVVEGAVERNAKARIVRDGVVVTENRDIESLRRVKDDVKEVRMGTECGIRLAGFDDVKPDDRIECYRVIKIKRTLD